VTIRSDRFMRALAFGAYAFADFPGVRRCPRTIICRKDFAQRGGGVVYHAGDPWCGDSGGSALFFLEE